LTRGLSHDMSGGKWSDLDSIIAGVIQPIEALGLG
jgi:hypothetical protein